MQPASRPEVSIVMPVRDAAPTVQRAVDSMAAQTFQAWELVAVDDGSHDESAVILERLAQKDPRLRILRCGREGVVAALNAGLEIAGGRLVARMDADDVSHPHRLAEQVEFLRRQPGIGVVGCLVEFGGDRKASEGYALYVDWINSLRTPEEIGLNRFVESPFAHPSVMFRRELVGRYGGYRPGDFPEDYELWLRWLDAGVRMAKVPHVLLTWHDGPERLSRSDSRYDPEKFFATKAGWIARYLKDSVAGHAVRPVFIWGAGRPTRKRAALLEQHGVRISGYIDVDAKKATPALGGTGLPVIGPGGLPPPGEIFVLGYVSSRGARDLIRHELRSRGYVEGQDFLMCA